MDINWLFIYLAVLAVVIVAIIGFFCMKKKGLFATRPKCKIVAITVGIILVIFFVVFSFVALPWTLIYVGGWFSPNPPQPEITYGEFPFKLVYEMKDETIVVEDTYICEYDGIGWNEGSGKQRKWKGYVKSTGDEGVLIAQDENCKIYCYIGSAQYYMGDENQTQESPSPVFVKISVDENITNEQLLLEDALSSYGIQPVELVTTEPIENQFH